MVKGKGLNEKHDGNIDRRNEVRGRHLQNTNVDLSSSVGSQLAEPVGGPFKFLIPLGVRA